MIAWMHSISVRLYLFWVHLRIVGILVHVGILVSMCIGFGLCDMFVIEADIQLQFYRMVTEFVWFLVRTATSWCFSCGIATFDFYE